MGYLPNVYDPCVFSRVIDDEVSTILLYVDDLMVFADTDESLIRIINDLKSIYKEVSYDIGIKHSYLGLTFKFDDSTVSIHMEGYINNLGRWEYKRHILNPSRERPIL